MKNVMVYPVDSEYLPFLKNCDFTEKTENIFCYAPEGWFYVNKSISTWDNKEITVRNIKECTDYSSFDSVWIVDSNGELDFSLYILPVVEQALSEKKFVRITRALSTENQTLCSKLFGSNDRFCMDQESVVVSQEYTPNILRIQTPVVFVLGMFEHTGKLDTLLYLHNGMQQAGYAVKSILTRKNETNENNYIPFPDFMYDKQSSDTDKIFRFNHFVRKLELEDKPDIILIGLPGEVMPLDEKHTGNFGVFPFLVSNAIHCDFAILKLFHNYYDSTFAEKMKEIIKSKYEIDISAFAVDNNILDVSSISTSMLKFYESKERPEDLPQTYYFNHINGKGEPLCKEVIETLQRFGNYRII